MHCSPGGLPWEHVEATSEKEWHRKVSAVKKRTPVEDLCNHVPNEFVSFLNYCRGLGFDAQPDYTHLRKLLKEIFIREGYKYDFSFDWIDPPSMEDSSSDSLTLGFFTSTRSSHVTTGEVSWNSTNAETGDCHSNSSSKLQSVPENETVTNSSRPNVADACMTECRSGVDVPDPTVRVPRGLPRRTYKARPARLNPGKFSSI